ncbi:leucine-rich repeat domain-containing protein [Anatilimnocola floriformis]|uniref:leucine-rich repeat domain-containing protein n=1 Tax=Anatilimnocola floriformis TaxID=2948575 RepID=UPI0020C36D00|nr:hypothetical protein [Anatilimnocola floriformis]
MFDFALRDLLAIPVEVVGLACCFLMTIVIVVVMTVRIDAIDPGPQVSNHLWRGVGWGFIAYLLMRAAWCAGNYFYITGDQMYRWLDWYLVTLAVCCLTGGVATWWNRTPRSTERGTSPTENGYWRFSLRGMILAQALLAICGGFWVAWMRQRAAEIETQRRAELKYGQEQLEIAQRFFQSGWQPSLTGSAAAQQLHLTLYHPNQPAFLRPAKLRPENLLPARAQPAAALALIRSEDRIAALEIESTNLTGDDLKTIAKFTTLERLSLVAKTLGPELAELKRLTKLTRLHLEADQLDEAAFADLATLPNLRDLYIRSNELTDEGIAAVSKLPALQELSVVSNALTDRVFDPLRSAKPLRRLNINLYIFRPLPYTTERVTSQITREGGRQFKQDRPEVDGWFAPDDAAE